MRVLVLAVAVVAAAMTPSAALGKGKVFFEDTVPSGKSTSVRIRTYAAPAFRVVLRVPTQGRAKLYLLGKAAPKGGALIDTKTHACEGAAGSFYCNGSYEKLPAGSYTWRIAWVGVAKTPAHVELTVRW